jgi:hypothetical protein
MSSDRQGILSPSDAAGRGRAIQVWHRSCVGFPVRRWWIIGLRTDAGGYCQRRSATRPADDRAAFEAAAMPFLDSLYNTAYRLARNAEDAEDLVQETFLKGYRSYAQFTPGNQL